MRPIMAQFGEAIRQSWVLFSVALAGVAMALVATGYVTEDLLRKIATVAVVLAAGLMFIV
jgi:hypothetical protein